MAMSQEEHQRLIEKTQATKQTIEEARKSNSQRKHKARCGIEEIKIDKELGLV